MASPEVGWVTFRRQLLIDGLLRLPQDLIFIVEP